MVRGSHLCHFVINKGIVGKTHLSKVGGLGGGIGVRPKRTKDGAEGRGVDGKGRTDDGQSGPFVPSR